VHEGCTRGRRRSTEKGGQHGSGGGIPYEAGGGGGEGRGQSSAQAVGLGCRQTC